MEQRIETLANNAVMKDGRMEATFSVGQVRYSHWDFDPGRGWASDYWLAEASIEAENYKAAFLNFRRDLSRTVPRIALISQTYIDFVQQPFLITKDGERVGFFLYRRKRAGVGLLFVEKHRDALIRLLADPCIPDEFYYYWNDVVNAVGYTPKLLLMCSAVECLTRVGRGEKDWGKVEELLGRDLKEELFGTKGNSSSGLRHRLIHGEYFGPSDSGKNYVELIHKRVLTYFNERILSEEMLDLNVVNPQRHFVGSVEGGAWFIRSKKSDGLSLRRVLLDFSKNDVNGLEDHELVVDDSLSTTY